MSKRLMLLLVGIALLVPAKSSAQTSIVDSRHDLSMSSASWSFDPEEDGSIEKKESVKKATNVSEICVFCHTSHAAINAKNKPLKQVPLWNHKLSDIAAGGYTLYTSRTMTTGTIKVDSEERKGGARDPGGAALGSANSTQLCLSCHDGTVGVGALLKNPRGVAPDNAMKKVGGLHNLGTDLSDDHPVNVDYEASYHAELGGGCTGDDDERIFATNCYGLKDPNLPAVKALLENDHVQCSSCHDAHNPRWVPFLVKSNDRSALCLTCHNK